MLLEEVPPNSMRDDLYINTVITPHDKVKNSDKLMVKRILMQEVARKELEVIAK